MGRPVGGQLALIRVLSRINMLLVICGGLAIPAFGWWAIVISPLILISGFFYMGRASIGRQNLVGVSIFLVLAIIDTFSQTSWSLPIKALIISVAITFFLMRYLFFFTTRFVFSLVYSSYQFFSYFYLKPADKVGDVVLHFIWTDPEYKETMQRDCNENIQEHKTEFLDIAADTQEEEKNMEDFEEWIKTPSGTLLSWSYNLAGDTTDMIYDKLPFIEEYENHQKLGQCIQIGNIIASTLKIEMFLGKFDYTNFHESIIKSTATSVQDQYFPAIRSLSAFILRTREETIPTGTIPDFRSVYDEKVWVGISLWIVCNVFGKMPVSKEELFLQNAIEKIIWGKNAEMIKGIVLEEINTVQELLDATNIKQQNAV